MYKTVEFQLSEHHASSVFWICPIFFFEFTSKNVFSSNFQVRQVMMGSKLSTNHLGRIWDLSDIDRDGCLTRYEFTVAMHLTYRCLQGDKLPAQLPPELSEEKVPKPLSAIPNLASAAPKVHLPTFTESFKL